MSLNTVVFSLRSLVAIYDDKVNNWKSIANIENQNTVIFLQQKEHSEFMKQDCIEGIMKEMQSKSISAHFENVFTQIQTTKYVSLQLPSVEIFKCQHASKVQSYAVINDLFFDEFLISSANYNSVDDVYVFYYRNQPLKFINAQKCAQNEVYLNALQAFDNEDDRVISFLSENHDKIIVATEYLLKIQEISRIRQVKQQLLSLHEKYDYPLHEFTIASYETCRWFRINSNYNQSICDLVLYNPRFIIDEPNAATQVRFCPSDSILLRNAGTNLIDFYIVNLNNLSDFVNNLQFKYRIYLKHGANNLIRFFNGFSSSKDGPTMDCSKMRKVNDWELYDAQELLTFDLEDQRVVLPTTFCNLKIKRSINCEIPLCNSDSIFGNSLKVATFSAQRASVFLNEAYTRVPILHFSTEQIASLSEPFITYLKFRSDFFSSQISMRDRYLLHNNFLYNVYLKSTVIHPQFPNPLDFVYYYIDNFPLLKTTLQSDKEYEELLLLKDFINAGTPNETPTSSLSKFKVFNYWYSDCYSTQAARTHMLKALDETLREKRVFSKLEVTTMKKIPKKYGTSLYETPKRYEFKIHLSSELLLSEFFQTYFLAYLQDPRIGEAYQRDIMRVIYKAVISLELLRAVPKTKAELKNIENSFLFGKIWLIETNGLWRFSKYLTIDVKTSFFSGKQVVTATSKVDRTLEIWRHGFS